MSVTALGVVGEPVYGPEGDAVSAGDVLQRRLYLQVGAMTELAGLVREGSGDGVHKMRVATRRLRSAMRSFAPLFDGHAVDEPEGELQWLGGHLGRARDIEVLRRRLDVQFRDLPPDAVLGSVHTRIEQRLGAEYADARSAVLDALDGERYHALRLHLEQVVADPPFSDVAGEAARGVLRPILRHEIRRLRHAVAAAVEEARPGQRDVAFHRARKTAKRVRYAAETVQVVFERDAKHCAETMEHFQQILGERQDAVVSAAFLRQEGARTAQAGGENGYTLGFLAALERVRVGEAEARFEVTWRRRNRTDGSGHWFRF